MHELHKKYRPRTFAEVVGQDNAVRTLSNYVKSRKLPHALLLSGPSGCGKTTLARVVGRAMGCDPDVAVQFTEINAAEERGIDLARDIKSRWRAKPLGGAACRFYVLDEGHKLTADAQNALLKMTEDTPPGVYFVICSSEPHRLIKAILNRFTEVKVSKVGGEDLRALLGDVLDREEEEASEAVLDKVVEEADGSPRLALKLLDKVLQLSTEAERLAAVQNTSHADAADKLVRMLTWDQRNGPRPKWDKFVALLKGLRDDGDTAEAFRQRLIGAAGSVLLNGYGHKGKAMQLIQLIRDPWYSGFAELTAVCYELSQGK